MTIGIDAKWFFRGPVSTRVILQNLLPELFLHFPEHEWIIFLDIRDKKAQFPFQSPKVKIQYVWAEINMISNLFFLNRKFKSLGVEVMVYQTFPSLTNKIPSISFIHDVLFRDYSEFFTWKEKLYFFPLNWLTRNRSLRLIATTESVSDDLLKYRYTSSKSRIDIVPLAVSKMYKPLAFHNDANLLAVREKFRLPERYLLYVGRLNVRKNIENLLKSLLLLHDSQIKLVIVGKADWKTPDLREILSKPEISKRIILTGSVSDDELAFVYSMACVFCFPSFAEGFGLPPLEAMASGVPVVVSDTTSLPEVCGNAAVYINPYKSESIADGINELLENHALYGQQKINGLQRAKEFTWERSARAFMKSINNAVNNA
jgi:glycosyltransferase involved in cell wall biosynthesis